MTTVRPDADKVKALAALQVNGGNVKRTAAETGVPRSTIGRWRDQALADGGGDGLLPQTAPWPVILEQAAERFLETSEKARQIVDRNLDKLRDTDMSIGDVQRAAVTSGIMADKATHLRGTGPEIAINVQAQLVQKLDGFSIADLRAVLEEDDAARAREAAVLPAGDEDGA